MDSTSTSNCESHLLVKDGPVSAEEAVLGSACHDSIVVLDWQADVEDLGRGYLLYQSCPCICPKDKEKGTIPSLRLGKDKAHLTATFHIGIVAVILTLAAERVRIVRPGHSWIITLSLNSGFYF